MSVSDLLVSSGFALSEGSIYERLRREPSVQYDPLLSHATLIYDAGHAAVLERVHREYLDVGQRHRVPMLAQTDTWRSSGERIQQSAFRGRDVNGDNVRFLMRIRDSYGDGAAPIVIGGQMGPRGDAYTPEIALAPDAAFDFHTPQASALAAGGAEVLYAATLPAVSEARGLARAMAAQKLPFIISFVIRPDGTVLDGTPLAAAIKTIDDEVTPAPTGYAVNCVHPSVFCDGLAVLAREAPALVARVVSYQANTSAKSPKELDGSSELQTEDADVLAHLLVRAHERFGTRVLGGCCGTDTSHIESLARALQAGPRALS